MQTAQNLSTIVIQVFNFSSNNNVTKVRNRKLVNLRIFTCIK